MGTIFYKRATFVTHLPTDYLYTQSHCWIGRVGDGAWRVGYTKFALRMLGELVDVKFEVKPSAPIQLGQIVGTIEGFKAISDIYCVGDGNFTFENAGLATRLEYLGEKPYDEGWMYQFTGNPDPRAMNVDGYRALLDATIDHLLAKQRQEEETP